MGHQHRDNLAGEYRFSDIGQLILYCFFMAVWLSDMFLKYSNFLNAHIPSAIRLPIGFLLLIIAGYMAGSGLMIVFNKKAQTRGVIRNGVFSLVRHPIYLSEIIMYFGDEYRQYMEEVPMWFPRP